MLPDKPTAGLASGIALTSDNLSRDFAIEQLRTQNILGGLYQALGPALAERDGLVPKLFEQWRLFFSEAIDYSEAFGGRKLEPLKKWVRKAGLEVKSAEEAERFFFVLHTYFALLVKLLAWLALSRHLGVRLGAPSFASLVSADGETLRRRLREMESGGIFRAYGILNLLEGDFFEWYLHAWNEKIEGAIREVIRRLDEYDPTTLTLMPEETRDLFKKLYHYLLPREIRHNLGEYYTPDWLAGRLLTQVDNEFFAGAPSRNERGMRQKLLRTRFLDPACGSGTFPILVIARMIELGRALLVPESELLHAILNNVVGFDINPLAVLTARVNYLLAIADLLEHRRGDITIPIYLADSVRMPAAGKELVSYGAYEFPTAVGTFRVPAGLIEMSNGTRAVVYMDSRYLLGPEGAHVNITGISGLATKTSYAIFLIQSILQKAENRDRIGVIILNVKHGDLLTIDQPTRGGLSPEQHELWERLGLTPQPFSNVRYLLPHGKDTPTTGRPNSFRIPERNWSLYAYSLADTYNKLDLLLSNIPDPWDTVGALIGEISQGLSDPKTGQWGPTGKWKGVTDWNSLLNGEPLVKEGQAQSVGDVRAVSVGRFRRLLRRIVQTRQTGIFVSQRDRRTKNLSEEIAKIRGGETIVVDIARLADDEQTLVFGDILRTIYALYAEEGSEREDLPEKVIIFVDELNKYAPAREKASPIIEQVLDIAERGRSLGVVLLGAEQFMSAVHDRVVGNCSTNVIGRSGSAELSSPVYRFLDPAVKANISRLQKGELVISHATFRQPVKIRFPRPAYLQEGVGEERRKVD